MQAFTGALNRRGALARALVMTAAAGQATLATRSLAQPAPSRRRPAPQHYNVTTIRGQTDENGRLLRLRDRWEAQFLVEIRPLLMYHNTFDSTPPSARGPQPVTLNLRPIIMDAMHEWDRSRIPVRLVRAGQTASVRIGQGRLAQPTMLGWTNVLPTTREITISLENIAAAAWQSYEALVRLGQLDRATTTLSDYAKMLLALTVRHELGHALGLGHTVGDSSGTDQPNGDFIEIAPADDFDSVEPSVMVADHLRYFQALQECHLRSVTVADVRVSDRDIYGANIMWDGRGGQLASLDLFACGVAPMGCNRDEL